MLMFSLLLAVGGVGGVGGGGAASAPAPVARSVSISQPAPARAQSMPAPQPARQIRWQPPATAVFAAKRPSVAMVQRWQALQQFQALTRCRDYRLEAVPDPNSTPDFPKTLWVRTCPDEPNQNLGFLQHGQVWGAPPQP